MLLTVGMFLGILLLAGGLLSAVAPVALTARLAALATTLQIHTIAVLGIYPSLALLAWLATWPAAAGNRLWRWPWMRAVAVLALIQAASIAWSPNPILGLRYLIYFAPLPLAALAFYKLASTEPRKAAIGMRLILAPTAGLAALVIAFRVFPSLEASFLTHRVAGVFVSPNTLEGLFGTGRNNVLDPSKAGGFFVNANIASTYLGASAMIGWYLGRAERSRALQAIAVLCWVAVLFTGSKAGLFLALAIPTGLGALGLMRTGRARPWRLLGVILLFTAAAILLATPPSQILIESYQYEALSTLGTRDELWSRARQLILQQPLAGLGFGGWERLFALQAFLSGKGVMPAHNSLVILWLQSGLFAVLAGLAVIVTVYRAAAHALHADVAEVRTLATGLIGAFSWYVIQGFGENFGLVGEAHLTPMLGALLGLLCARVDISTAASSREGTNERETQGGYSAPPALSAV